jgi:hypothetical protein
MRWLIVERALWTVAAITAGTAVTLVRRSTTMGEAGMHVPLPRIPAAPPRITASTLEAAVNDIADGDLFRPEREMPDPPAAGAPGAAAMPAGIQPLSPPRPGRPHLVLRGVIGGPPWDAVVEGIPGRDGATVVRVGQTIAGVTVRSIRGDTVFARGLDTTWTLTLVRSW